MSNFVVCIFTTDVRMVYLLSSVTYSNRSDCFSCREYRCRSAVGLNDPFI